MPGSSTCRRLELEEAVMRLGSRGFVAMAIGVGIAAMPAAGRAGTPPAAAAPIASLPCATYAGLTVCSGEVPSFDTAPLDVDITKPASSGGSHPLMVLFHGFGNNKHEWESTSDVGDNADKWHWNSHWFAEHGYYVLTYTARGFRDNGPTRADEPATPSGLTFASAACATPGIPGSACLPDGTLRVKSKEVEIRDSQWLSALTASAFSDIDPNRVAVSGGSYGGGESWLQAAEPVWRFPNSLNSALPVMQLQVAVPKYPWTDLSYSLAPNGHGGGPSMSDIYESSQGRQDSPTGAGNPYGVGKQSYVTGLYALGTTNGIFEEGTAKGPQQTEGPTPFTAWQARVAVGEPYDLGPAYEDPIIAQIRRDFSQYHSAYYQRGWAGQPGQREVAVYSISGWTDDLFTPVESFRMFKYLKRLDPQWPVWVGVADVGHSRAQNKPGDWHPLNDQAWSVLQSNINGSHRQPTNVFSEPTVCTPNATTNPTDAVVGPTPEGLAAGSLSVQYAQGGVLLPDAGAADPNGPATDAVVGPSIPPNENCRKSVAASSAPFGGYTAYSAPLQAQQTFVGIGYVRLSYALAGTDAILATRIWDVAPDGQQLLVTRGVYRLNLGYDAIAGTIRVPVYGNHWRFAAGHVIRIDLVQADAPTYRPGNPGATGIVGFLPPTLTLPVREGSNGGSDGGSNQGGGGD